MKIELSPLECIEIPILKHNLDKNTCWLKKMCFKSKVTRAKKSVHHWRDICFPLIQTRANHCTIILPHHSKLPQSFIHPSVTWFVSVIIYKQKCILIMYSCVATMWVVWLQSVHCRVHIYIVPTLTLRCAGKFIYISNKWHHEDLHISSTRWAITKITW